VNKLKGNFLVVVFSAFLIHGNAFAGVGAGFEAPIIDGKSNVYNPVAGEIIYDQSDSTFYGRNHSNNWQALGGSSALQTPGGGNENLGRARIAACTSSPCTITRQSGTTSNYISSVTRASAGSYTATIVSGVFSETPTCFCSTEVGGQFCSPAPGSATSVSIQITDHAGAQQDPAFSLFCFGAR
jgi:hypothetical protein